MIEIDQNLLFFLFRFFRFCYDIRIGIAQCACLLNAEEGASCADFSAVFLFIQFSVFSDRYMLIARNS